MEQSINEVKSCIAYHELRIGKIGNAMWGLILLAAFLYFLIYVMLDVQVKNLAQIIKFSVENGIKNFDSAPTSLATAANGGILATVVIGMCAARLLVYFGQLRFHLKEVALHQQSLISLSRIRAASEPELNEKVRDSLLANSSLTVSDNEPSLHVPTETIAKLSDAISERVQKIVKGN